MAAMTAAAARRYRPWGKSVTQNWRVANADTMYLGALAGLPGANALTSRRGYLTPWANQQNLVWVGLVIGAGTAADLSTTNTIVGSTSAAPVVEATTESGPFVIEQVAVAGVSAQTDVMRTLVYDTTDNTADLTTTAGQAGRIGIVLYWWSSTTCDVLFYGALNLLVL